MLVDPNEDNSQRVGGLVRRSRQNGDSLSSRSSHRPRRRRRHRRSQLQNINNHNHNDIAGSAGPSSSNLISPNTTNTTASTTASNANGSNDDDDEKPTLLWLFKQLAINYTIGAISLAITFSFIYWMETSFEKRVRKKNRVLRSDAFQTVISQCSHNLLASTNGNNNVVKPNDKLLILSAPTTTIAKNSPQYDALEWLVSHDPLHLSPWNTELENDIIERYALATLYYSMSTPPEVLSPTLPFVNFEANYTIRGVDIFDNCGGANNFNPYIFIDGNQFTSDVSADNDDDDDDTNEFPFGDHVASNKPWLSKYSVCYWQGIHCNYKDRITRIQLEKLSIVGTIPSEIAFLSNLEVLDLGFNMYSGTIPSELGLCSSMKHLDFEKNLFESTIPKEIGSLISLKTLELNDNNVSGTVPTELKQLHQLESVDFNNNRLRGDLNPMFCDSNYDYASINQAFVALHHIFSNCQEDPQRISCDCCAHCTLP